MTVRCFVKSVSWVTLDAQGRKERGERRGEKTVAMLGISHLPSPLSPQSDSTTVRIAAWVLPYVSLYPDSGK